MKKLGKSEIEAKKRLNLEAASEGRWEFQNWARYSISGRVLPERCCVDVPKLEVSSISEEGRCVVQSQILSSHVNVVLFSEGTDLTLFQISSIIRQVVCLPIDYIGFVNRGYYDVVLDTCIGPDNILRTMPVYEPIFEPDRDGFLFKATSSARIEGINIPLGALIPEARLALHDLSQAFRYPVRTLEYCRMAIEAIRSYFDPDTKKNRSVLGEIAMCTTLKVAREKIKSIESYAAPARHADANAYSNWDIRKEASEISWEIFYRFVLFVDGNSPDDWRLIE